MDPNCFFLLLPFQGYRLSMECKHERDVMAECIEKWLYNPEFREAVSEEYLNERSHFRYLQFFAATRMLLIYAALKTTLMSTFDKL